jgi:hypothetical protein
MDGSADAMMANASTYDSDADAEGSSDDYFEEAAYQVANGVAQKTPRPWNTRLKLKINVPAATANTKTSFKSARRPSAAAAKTKTVELEPKPKPKPKRKPGPAPGTVYKKRGLVELPNCIKQKVQPDNATDLLALIAFETENYNKHPKRQEDIKEMNDEIKKQNDDLEHKIQREIKKQTPVPERNKYDRKAKRKVTEDESGPESVARVRQRETKSKKTKKVGNEAVSVFEILDAVNAVTANGRDDDAITIADETGFHGSTGGEARHDTSFTDLGFATDSDGSLALPPLRRLEPAPGAFLFDEHSNAVPNPAYRQHERSGQCSLGISGDTPQKSKQKNADLKTLMSTPKKELVSFVPKQMNHLVKRVKGRGGELSQRGGGVTPRVDEDEDVMMDDADLPSPKLLLDLQQFARNDSAMVAGMMDIDVTTGRNQSGPEDGNVDSEVDADGETDVE